MSKIDRYCLQEMCKNWMSVKLNIFCLDCINLHYVPNYANKSIGLQKEFSEQNQGTMHVLC